MKPQKQYGDFAEYPYPLSDEERAIIGRAWERFRRRILAEFHARERECDLGI